MKDGLILLLIPWCCPSQIETDGLDGVKNLYCCCSHLPHSRPLIPTSLKIIKVDIKEKKDGGGKSCYAKADALFYMGFFHKLVCIGVYHLKVILWQRTARN